MVKIHFTILILSGLLWNSLSFAQADDSAYLKQDTAHKISSGASNLLQILEQQKQDSIKRKELEGQLISVKISEQQEKQKLLQEINMLKSRDSLLYVKRKQAIDSLRQLNKGVPVVPYKDTLFIVYSGVGSYSKTERANSIVSRIQTLSDNYAFEPDSLTIKKEGNNWIVFWQDHIIASIEENDAMWADMSLETMAHLYFDRIKNDIKQYREDNSLKKLIIGILFACLIVFTVTLIIIGINRLISWIKKKILLLRDRFLKGIKIKGYEFISPNQQVKFIWTILYGLKWVLILTCVYLALPILLNLFPSTEGYAPVLLGYFIKPLKDVAHAVISYFPKLITIVVICFIFRYVLKALRFFAKELQTGALNIPGFYKDWALPTHQILRVLLFAFLLVIVFPYLPGANSPIFKGVSVFIGVLFTFGSAGALSNIVAGLLLTYMRPFAIGDWIKIGDVAGDIIEKNLLATRIRTIKNEVISVPNSQVMNSHTINYSSDIEQNPLIVYTHITIGYDIPWHKVHELAKNACAKVELLESSPAPFILQSSLDDFYVNYQVNAYTRNPHKQAVIYSEMHKHLLDAFHEAGIEIMSPHFHAVRKNSTPDIPPGSTKDKQEK